MNESHVAYDKTPVWFSASVEISGDGMVHTKEKVDGWDRISAAWEGIWISSVNWLAVKPDVLETVGQDGENLRSSQFYDFPGGDYASCLYLHAREKQHHKCDDGIDRWKGPRKAVLLSGKSLCREKCPYQDLCCSVIRTGIYLFP